MDHATRDEALRDELLRMEASDLAVRAELAADGSLFDGYHPRMAAVHDAHAERLRAIIRAVGWPTEAMVGPDGAGAAWRIAQHAINHPDFMRECRALVDGASASGAVPRWHFAYLDDRIRALEGAPQRYGTQWRDTVDGQEPYPLEEPDAVDARRAELGLPPLAALRTRAPDGPPRDPAALRAVEAAELEWRRRVGWLR